MPVIFAKLRFYLKNSELAMTSAI